MIVNAPGRTGIGIEGGPRIAACFSHDSATHVRLGLESRLKLIFIHILHFAVCNGSRAYLFIERIGAKSVTNGIEVRLLVCRVQVVQALGEGTCAFFFFKLLDHEFVEV